MTASGVPPVAAVALRDRALAPDVARGSMLLLIALANVHLYLYDRPLGVRLYPAGLTGADAVVAGLQMVLVDGRAYPLFGLLLGYGLGQLAARSAAVGSEPWAVVRLIRRRGWWLVAIGVTHVVLLWSGDIVAAYGLLTAALAGMVVTGTAVSLATTAVVGAVLGAGLGAFSGFSPRGTAPLPSIAVPDPADGGRTPPGRVGGRHPDRLADQRRRRGRARGVGGPAPDPGRARGAPAAPGPDRRRRAGLRGARRVAARARDRRRVASRPSACCCSRGPCTPWAGTWAGWATRRCSGCW